MKQNISNFLTIHSCILIHDQISFSVWIIGNFCKWERGRSQSVNVIKIWNQSNFLRFIVLVINLVCEIWTCFLQWIGNCMTKVNNGYVLVHETSIFWMGFKLKFDVCCVFFYFVGKNVLKVIKSHYCLKFLKKTNEPMESTYSNTLKSKKNENWVINLWKYCPIVKKYNRTIKSVKQL